MLEKIYVTEICEKDATKWFLSFGKPMFQGGESIEIDEKTAKELLFSKNDHYTCIRLFKDGDTFIAMDGENLQESKRVGLGESEDEALMGFILDNREEVKKMVDKIFSKINVQEEHKNICLKCKKNRICAYRDDLKEMTEKEEDKEGEIAMVSCVFFDEA